MKISVEVWTLDRNTDRRRKVTEAMFVFVAIDEQGRIRFTYHEPGLRGGQTRVTLEHTSHSKAAS